VIVDLIFTGCRYSQPNHNALPVSAEEGDMPRVYCQDHDYPGTAFSRSLGDFVAEDIGVNGEPEILTKKVTKGDEIVVIASDVSLFMFVDYSSYLTILSSNISMACSINSIYHRVCLNS